MTLLHAGEGAHLGEMSGGEIFRALLHDVLLDGLLDTLKIAVFLFLTYLLMEFIEHRSSGKIEGFIARAGRYGPAVGGLLGAVPQCGFSAAASNFYTGRLISMGTLVAIFLSTSDEMLPIMLSGRVSVGAVFAVLGYKLFVGMAVGFATDAVLHFMHRDDAKINIDEICENDNCHCERGIFHSALHHTLTIGGFVLLVTLLINALVFFVGEDALASVMYDKPFVGHLIAAVFGLIPNCAVSVALTTFCIDGYITAGTMLSGLFSGAGVGLLVLLRVNKHRRENAAVIAILLAAGVAFGMLADAIGFSALF